VGGASVAMDHACCQLIDKKLHAGQHHNQICDELGVSGSLVLKSKSSRMTARTSRHSRETEVSVQTTTAIATVQAAVAEILGEALGSRQGITR
jgi:hypothetical protein